MPLMASERQKTKDAYIEAFLLANPGKPTPILYYERGWWLLKTTPGIFSPIYRHRHAKILEMTATLRARMATVPQTVAGTERALPNTDKSNNNTDTTSDGGEG